MDLDQLLDEAAEATFKPEPAAVPKKKVDPQEIKPYLAATALVPPILRDKWSSYVRRDYEIVIKSNFLPSNSYQQGDSSSTLVPPNSNKLLFDAVKASTQKCGISESKATKVAAVVNPVTDNDVGKRLQVAYEKFIISSKKKEIESDINYDPKRFPNLALLLSKV